MDWTMELWASPGVRVQAWHAAAAVAALTWLIGLVIARVIRRRKDIWDDPNAVAVLAFVLSPITIAFLIIASVTGILGAVVKAAIGIEPPKQQPRVPVRKCPHTHNAVLHQITKRWARVKCVKCNRRAVLDGEKGTYYAKVPAKSAECEHLCDTPVETFTRSLTLVKCPECDRVALYDEGEYYVQEGTRER